MPPKLISVVYGVMLTQHHLGISGKIRLFLETFQYLRHPLGAGMGQKNEWIYFGSVKLSESEIRLTGPQKSLFTLIKFKLELTSTGMGWLEAVPT